MSIKNLFASDSARTFTGFSLTRVDAFRYAFHHEGLCSALGAFFTGRKVSLSNVEGVTDDSSFDIDKTLHSLLKNRKIETCTKDSLKNVGEVLSLDDQIKLINKDINDLSIDNNKLATTNDNIETKNIHLKSVINNLVNNECTDSKVTLQDCKIRLNYLNHKVDESKNLLNKLNKKKEDLLTKLSSKAGILLRENNPAITDLGDTNRPMKLAERYGEIYDNEWSDLADLLDTFGMNEKEQCTIPLNLFRSLHDEIEQLVQETLTTRMSDNNNVRKKEKEEAEAREKEKKETEENGNRSGNELPPPMTAILTKDSALYLMRNEFTSSSNASKKKNNNAIREKLESIKKKVKDKFLEGVSDTTDKKNTAYTALDKYLNSSYDFLFLSLTSAKNPMHFIFEHDRIDDTFKEFTRSGLVIDFIVWPALYLYKQGPLLWKGVAQPKDE